MHKNWIKVFVDVFINCLMKKKKIYHKKQNLCERAQNETKQGEKVRAAFSFRDYFKYAHLRQYRHEIRQDMLFLYLSSNKFFQNVSIRMKLKSGILALFFQRNLFIC